MSILEIIAAGLGFLIITIVLWNLRGPRFRGDGRAEPESDTWLNNDWPG